MAIRECERQRREGAGWIFIVWPYLWVLQHYKGFHSHLQQKYRRMVENDRLVVYALR
jgi:hypothetical protein